MAANGTRPLRRAARAAMKRITIVGAGFCGTMTAVHLLQRSRTPLHIRLVDRNETQVGRGVAYSTEEPCHLLNVPAGRMSAFPTDPDHFLRWANAHRKDSGAAPRLSAVTPDTYLPRKLYGDYLAELLRDAIAQRGHHTVDTVLDEVTGMDTLADSTIAVQTASGGQWQADACVLALGNPIPGTPNEWSAAFTGSRRYCGNPWSKELLPALLQASSCLLLGCGLTTLDVIASLEHHRYQGTIHTISRRGLVPLPHTTKRHPLPGLPTEIMQASGDLRRLLNRVRALAEQSSDGDGGWQAVIDALRAHTPSLWRALGIAQQKQFIRHVRRYWDHHRHRVAPPIRATFDRLVATGQVRLHRGRIEAVTDRSFPSGGVDVLLRTGGGAMRALSVDYVVNCTGPAALSRSINQPLFNSLTSLYPEVADPLGLGFTADADMRLPGAPGRAPIFSVGPPVKGALWECTAVPECRQDVVRVVAALADLTANSAQSHGDARPRTSARVKHTTSFCR